MFVIYSPDNIAFSIKEEPFVGLIRSGYQIVPYIFYSASGVKELFKGNYLQCLIVLNGLNSFSLN
jgi:hypothetical protein